MTSDNSQQSNASGSSDVNAGRDASSINIQGNNNVVHVGAGGDSKSSNHDHPVTAKGADGEPASKSSKRRAAKKPKKKAKPTVNPIIVVALISFVGVVITAMLTSPIIEKWLFPTPEASPTPVVLATDTPFAPETDVPETVSATALPPITVTVPVESPVVPATAALGEKMIASLQANMTEGKAPLTVTFDARSSYYQFADGTTAPCGNSILCAYTFTVYLNGQALVTVDNKSGTYSHPFGAKGKYFVTLYVCRGSICADDGMEVTVR